MGNKISRIERASVYGETPTDAQIAGDVRRQQVRYGVKLYKPSSKHVKGFSALKAAKQAIEASLFRNKKGAYKISEKDALKRAILREHKNPKIDSGTK